MGANREGRDVPVINNYDSHNIHIDNVEVSSL